MAPPSTSSRSSSTPPLTPRRAGSISDSLTAFGAMLSRVLSNETESPTKTTERKANIGVPSMSNNTVQERSVSRGREFHSSGRGGAGNIRPSSATRTADGPDDFSPTRGREVGVTTKLTHSGRGGAGNIHSPTREGFTVSAAEKDVLAAVAERDLDMPHSSGRGGFGNIDRSRSRSRASEDGGRPLHSSGRGGAGNILPGSIVQEVTEEKERREFRTQEAGHSTGRGGIANYTTTPTPGIDNIPQAHEPQHVYSVGRGGAGNIVYDATNPDTSVPSGGHKA